MKYVSILCTSAVVIGLGSPAAAGTGNALAGGWDGTLASRNTSPAASTAPTRVPASASTSPFSVEVFAGPSFSFGSGGGSSGNTGGAPSPEANTILSLLLVGGTVAFLRRRRNDEAKPQT
ncbi:PEP-CTERM protein-sorting domain-containing protein [Methylobacterium phyllostachyos]|uniref:PEP-CTERM protein-sorting domain-containing protein n=1 Tax=Methylobacterium phyllostachyos TaxID=582672 RepID=A0A1H0L7S1_9HYPH|nr:PEP-CTERM protein-sorting domain-containing protein [Methylobacterium phyllostachyos]